MSTIPPAQPPPPTPPMFNIGPLTPIQPNYNVNSICNMAYNSHICPWNTDNPQLTEACLKQNICLHQSPFKYTYKHVEPIIQVGPTCGLVSISMLLNGEVTPEEILSISKSKGYTSNGEMFSCKDMVKLTEKVLTLAEIPNVRCSLRVGGLCSDETVEKLLDGALLLVPYDADCNHSPCLRQGHTAHWAFICGVIVIKDLESHTCEAGNVYVLARHGKSRYLAAWRLDELAKSNKNLWEFSPKKGTDGLVYVLPEGGVGGQNGLRNQFLIFEGI